MSRPLVLVTTGPASAPIDRVRRITNFSTGETGALIAAALAEAGCRVILLRGEGALFTAAPESAEIVPFATNHDIKRSFESIAATRGADVRAVLHAAALSDYEVAGVRDAAGRPLDAAKIPGDCGRLELTLAPAPQLLPRLRGWFPRAWIVGWKYELEGTRAGAEEKARRQVSRGYADACVLNGKAYGEGFGWCEAADAFLHFPGKPELACFLARRVAAYARGDSVGVPRRQPD